MILVFTIDKQIITRRDNEKVVRDSVNYLHVNFSFSEEWTGDKTAVFKSKSGIAYNVLVGSDGSCLVPWEVLKEEYFEVSAFCGDLITANVVKVFTIPSGYEIGSQGRIPTPDIYTQIIARLSAIEAEIDPTAIQQVVDEYLSDKDYVTEQDVEQIVANYVEAHKDELKGDTGATGPQGPQGIQGPKGDTGEGVAAGGTTGQVLVKSSDADYQTEWKTVGNSKALETGIDLIAHRGLYGNGIPQNTIAAFINAFNDGFRWIEIDIRRTKDDVWVLAHDDVVTLYKNGISESVTISAKTYAELQDYTWDSEGQYKVDSLTKSLYELKKYNMTIIVDAKGETRTVDVCNIVADYGMQKHCYVSTTPTYIIAHSEELNKFKDISFRILVADYALGKQAISLLENPIILDVNAGRWNDRLPIALALRLPIVCADFTSTRIPENRKAVINVVSGVMDMDNVTFDVLNAGTHIPVDYSEITIAEDGGVCASSEQAATIHAQNDSDNGGYINLYTENPEIASLVQNTRGTNVNATITAVSDGVTVARAINGSIVSEVPVNVSMNGFFGFLGDVGDSTMKYTFNKNKITILTGTGDTNADFDFVKVRRFEYSDIGYYGKAFYIPEVPEGATKLHVSIDTTKASASIYVKTYSAEKVKLQSYSWQSDREITLTPDEKYYAIGLRYNDARQLQTDNHVSADFVTLLDAFSIEFT